MIANKDDHNSVTPRKEKMKFVYFLNVNAQTALTKYFDGIAISELSALVIRSASQTNFSSLNVSSLVNIVLYKIKTAYLQQ